MLKSRVILVLVAVVAGSVGLALGRRLAETAGAAAPSASSPYAADSSPVRGLTAREVDDLLNGRGAGFARTAELNGHPGPRHAIDLADDLELTDDQRAAAERIFAGMSAAAKRLGVEIVGRERRLSAAFAARRMTAETLRSETESLGVLYGRLRAVHLSAHLELTHVLTLPQIRRYDVLRGYHDSGGGQADTHVHRD